MPRLIITAVLVLLGSACSRTEFTYRNADLLLEYYAWKAMQTSAAQRDHWQPVLQTTLRRHREQELPLVIAYLETAIRLTGDPDGSPGAACLLDGALHLYQRHARLAVDLAAPLLAELDAAQIRHLSEYMTQRQQDAVKRYLDPDPQTRKQARLERIMQRIERWTGELTDSQRQEIKDELGRIPDLSASWLAYRAQQTDRLLVMLESGADAHELRVHLAAWWVHREGISAESGQRWRVVRHAFIQLMDGLAASLTDRQRTTLENRLGALREDLASFLPGTPEADYRQLAPGCTPSSSEVSYKTD
jgi:hypothetical protein